MSMLHCTSGGAGGATEGKFDASDVFSTYLYTGNGSTQTINNGIDLAGKGGMVWQKVRNDIPHHFLWDTERGSNSFLKTVVTDAAASDSGDAFFGNFLSNGFSTGTYYSNAMNVVSWTFRKAPKFFEQQTKVHTNGTASTIDLSALGTVGMVTVKATSTTSNWYTWHKGLTIGNNLKLNLTDAQSTTNAYLSVSGTTLTISASSPSATYVIYAWAHDPSADGIIQCGSYTGNGSSAGPIVNLGWEPQYLMIKNATGTGNWQIIDNMRGMPVGSADSALQANLQNAESSVDYVSPTATGFQITSTSSEVNTSAATYVYMAIRRPNKVPTSGTEVYNAIAATGSTNTVRTTNFPIDMQLISHRTATDLKHLVVDRLRGVHTVTSTAVSPILATSSTSAEDNSSYSATNKWDSKSFSDSAWANGAATVWHSFKRAKGFFDVVCYNGTNSVGGSTSKPHGLTVIPELIIVKRRDKPFPWYVKCTYGGIGISLESSAGSGTNYFPALLTASDFGVHTDSGGTSGLDALGGTYVAYLFASLPGISKVGSYTGNGSSQTINCGFSTGARFVLIKRTGSTGDWYVWDTARGIVANNDPHLSLNTAAAEVTTDDSVDPEASGFIVNQNTATNINVNAGTYIFLAIA